MAAPARRNQADIAIRDGIASRLEALGFKRKSRRLYLREDERFREWAHFSGSPLEFGDFIGIFDKEFDALFQQALGPDWPSIGLDDPLPAHVGVGALFAWRRLEDVQEAARRQNLSWFSPLKYLAWEPRRQSYRSPFTTDYGEWSGGVDPAGCAAASLAKWRELVEPWRERMRTDKRAFVEDYDVWPNGGGKLKDIVCHVYMGEREAAEAICRDILDREGLAPSEADLKRFYIRGSRSGWPAEPEIRNWIAYSFYEAASVRGIVAALGLKP